jgi:poly-gamma-glutamate synthesis protein (capsule biosynthesis protein)
VTEPNWNNGCWKNEAAAGADAEILIASDWAPIRAFERMILNDPEAVYGDLMPVLRQSDLRIVNLECPLTPSASPVWKSGSVLKGAAEHVRGLTVVPFEIATLGNNHVFDYGVDGFEQTRALLADNAVRTVGAGMSAEEAQKPLIVDVKHLKVGIINFSEGEDLTAAGDGPGVFGWQVDDVVSGIRRVRESVDVLIIICHCGVEYIPFPPPYVAEAFQRLAAEGADLVIGHHPHVPQGVGIHENTPICYSLGNFVFYQETDLKYRKMGYLIRAGISSGGLAGIEIVPYGIYSHGLGLLKDDSYRWFFEKLKRVSEPLDNLTGIHDAWYGFLRNYGIRGFVEEIDMLMARLRNEPEKGAAMFRNRIATMQHNRHWIDALTRMIDGRIDSSPQWAFDLTREWLTEKIT